MRGTTRTGIPARNTGTPRSSLTPPSSNLKGSPGISDATPSSDSRARISKVTPQKSPSTDSYTKPRSNSRSSIGSNSGTPVRTGSSDSYQRARVGGTFMGTSRNASRPSVIEATTASSRSKTPPATPKGSLSGMNPFSPGPSPKPNTDFSPVCSPENRERGRSTSTSRARRALTSSRSTSPACMGRAASPALSVSSYGKRAASPAGSVRSTYSANGGRLRTNSSPAGYEALLSYMHPESNTFTEELSEENLKTIVRQVRLLRYQIIRKIQRDREIEEKDLLRAWQLVYDAEEEAYNLKSKLKVAREVVKINQGLITIDKRISEVNNSIAPLFEVLHSAAGMYLEQSQSIQHIKNINNKTAANQDYANKINRMEKVVKIFGRLTQKQKRLIKTPIIKEASRINLLVSSNSMSPASMNRGLSEKSMSFVAESPLTSSSRRKSIQGNILFFADSVDDEDDNTLIRCDSVTDMIVGNESRTTVPSFTRSQSLAVTSSGAVLNNDRKNAAASSAGKGKETSLTSASKSMLGSRSKSTSTPTGASHRRGSSDASDISAKSKTGSTPKAAPMSQAEILSSIKPSSAGKALLNDVDDSTHGDSSAVSEVKPSTGEKGLSKKASEFDFFAIYTTPSQRQPAVDSNSTSSYSMEINQSLEEPLPAAPTDAMHALTNLSKQTYGSDSSQAPTPRAQTALLSPKINNTLSANRRGSAVLQQALNDPSTSLNPNSPTKRRQSIDDSPSASHKMFSPELAKVESVPTLEIAKTDTILSTEIKPSMAKPSSTEIGQNYHPVDSSTTTSVIPPFKEEEKLAVKPNLKVDTSRHTDAVRKPLAVDSRVNSQTQDIMKVIKDLKHASPVSNSRSNSVEKKHEFGKPVLRHVEPGMKSIEARKEKEVTEIKPREVRPVKDSVSTEKTEKSAPLTPTKAKKPDEVSPFKRVTLRPASLPRKGSIERIEFPEHLAPVPVLLDEDDAGSAATQKHLSEKRKNTVKAYVKQKNMEIEFKRTTSLVDMKPRSNSASPERGRLPAISGNSSTNNSSRASTPDSISAVNITREPFSTGVSPANSVDKRGIAGLDNSGSLSITEANFDEVLSSLDHVSADKSAETCNKNKKATKPTLRRNPDASYSMYTNTTGLSDYDKDVDHPDSKTGNIHIEESLSGVRVELMSTSDDSLSPKRSPSIRPFHVKEKESFLERTLPTVPGENGNDQGKIEAAGRPPLVPSTTVDFKTKNDELKEDNYPAMSTELPTGNASSDVNAREPSISKGFFAIMGNSSDSQVLQDNFKTSGTDDKAEASLNDQVQPETGILLGNLSSPSVKSDMTMSDAGSRPPTLKKKKSMAKMVRYLILGKNKKKHALDLAEFETVSNADSNHGSTPNVRDSWDSTSQAGAVDGGKDRKSTGELNTSAGSKEKKIPIEGSSLDENSVSGSVISGLPLDQQSVAASSAPGDEGVPKKKKGFFKLVKHSIIGSKKKKYADDNQSIAESATEGQH